MSRQFLNRALIIGFLVLVSYAVANGIRTGSIIGIVLSLVALGAGGYFFYLLAKMKQQLEQEEQRETRG